MVSALEHFPLALLLYFSGFPVSPDHCFVITSNI